MKYLDMVCHSTFSSYYYDKYYGVYHSEINEHLWSPNSDFLLVPIGS